MGFSERLELLRKSKNMSQKELADILNIDRTSIVHYENSNNDRIPRPDTLFKIADFFEVSIDYLLGRTDRWTVTLSEDSNEEYLSLIELQQNYQLTVDDEPVSEEELETVIEIIQDLRNKK